MVFFLGTAWAQVGKADSTCTEAHFWLTSNQIGVMLIERGLAVPAHSRKYTQEFAAAQAFAKANKLGLYAATATR